MRVWPKIEVARQTSGRNVFGACRHQLRFRAERPVGGRTTDAEGRRNRPGRFPAVVHSTGQGDLLVRQRPQATDGLAACPACFS